MMKKLRVQYLVWLNPPRLGGSKHEPLDKQFQLFEVLNRVEYIFFNSESRAFHVLQVSQKCNGRIGGFQPVATLPILIALLNTWQSGDISIIRDGGDYENGRAWKQKD
jgi:hypothetical protein